MVIVQSTRNMFTQLINQQILQARCVVKLVQGVERQAGGQAQSVVCAAQ